MTPVLLFGVFFATFCSLGVIAEYLALVPLKRRGIVNHGAWRFLILLGCIAALLLLTVSRYVLGEYPFRIELITVFFYALSGALLWIARGIWHDQLEGAKKYRERKQTEEASNG